MIKRPKLNFSDWIKWDRDVYEQLNTRQLPFSSDLEWPGIYVWAWFAEMPISKMSLNRPPKEILYIGESKRPLRNRIDQFSKGYFSNHRSHDGGRRCAEMTNGLKGNLYLCFAPVHLENEPDDFWEDIYHWSRAFLHFAERTVIWNYVKHWGKRPQANDT